MSDYKHRLMVATDLLQQCHEGFGAFINGRKMARKDREALRMAIARFMDGRMPEEASKPTPEYGQCATCGVFSDSAKALHDANGCKE